MPKGLKTQTQKKKKLITNGQLSQITLRTVQLRNNAHALLLNPCFACAWCGGQTSAPEHVLVPDWGCLLPTSGPFSPELHGEGWG